MGGLGSGPGPGICILTLLVLCLAQQTQSAPVQEDSLSSQSRGYYDGSSSEVSSGCYYNFQHYGEGDRIITNEPCLNCTCHNRMLMCYLRVCPFTKAIGQNCTIEKQPGQCCPLIICPEVPVQLLTSSTTTEHSESMPHRNQIGYGQHSTAVGHLDDYGCRINGEFYTNGAQIPGNIDKPCEVCYCIRNRTACIMQECTLQVEGCIPVYEEGLCCPVRYQCDYEYNYNQITTEQPRPTPGLILTTTTTGPFECQHDNKWYADGASVDTEDPCEHCYCMKGDIVCAVQECKTPFEKDGHNCTAMAPPPGKCCPDSYHCDGNEIEIEDESEPTFRQDRMHKFGENNANVTMSITSSTSSSDKHHGWHYGGTATSNETPNRFSEDQDGTKAPGGAGTAGDLGGEMIVTEGTLPTVAPPESDSHHVEGHSGSDTDNSFLTVSQVIYNLINNQTSLLNQNLFNLTMPKPEEKQNATSGQSEPLDHKIPFPGGAGSKRPAGVRPDGQTLTDEDGNPIESHEGTTEFPEDYYGFTDASPGVYSEHGGRPQTGHKKPGMSTGHGASMDKHKPGVHTASGGHGQDKRPGEGGSGDSQGMTETPEGFTGQPGSGRPQKRPVVHKRPGMDGTLVLTDDEGNPMEVYEGVTGVPEGFTGRPGTGVHTMFGEHGHTGRPGGHKRPGMGGAEGMTDEDGVTGAPEDFTGKPDSDMTYVFYDEHGRPHRRPVGHKEPGMVGGSDVQTDEDGSAVEGVTRTPEGDVSKPELAIFGEHGHTGRPHKRPGLHTRPGGATDQESVTGDYEGVTGAPESDGTYVYFDKDGRPHRRPVVHKRPGMAGSEVQTDEDGNAVEGATGSPEGFTGKPGGDGVHTLYGEHGHAGRPGVHKRPGVGAYVTDEPGLTTEMFEGMTESPDGYTGQPGEPAIFGEHGRPHKRPVIHKKPGAGGAGEEDQEFESATESYTGKPESDQMGISYQIFYDKYGRPHRRPVIHKKPGMEVMTDEHGKPIEGVTETPEGYTGKPETDGLEVYYDQYGRPHRRPVVHGKPSTDGVMTDEHGEPVDGFTESPEGFTGATEGMMHHVIYDQYGRPHKRPVVHKKPGSQGTPVEEHEGTEVPEDHTGKPEEESMPGIFGEHGHTGRPHKRPIVHKKPGTAGSDVVTDEEGATGAPEDTTGMPEIFGEHGHTGRPHKRPIIHNRPGAGSGEGTTGSPGGATNRPDGRPEIFGEHGIIGRPFKRPGQTKPMDTSEMTDEEGMTKAPGGFTERPDEYEAVSGEPGHTGRPQKRPVGPKRPGVTDEVGATTGDYEGVTETPEGFTGKPGSLDEPMIYGEHGHTGRPHKKPVVPGQSDPHIITGDHGSTTEGYTGRPESVHDEHGRPTQKPDQHKPMDHEHGKPSQGATPEDHTAVPESDGLPAIFGEHGHTGRPHGRPELVTPGPEGILTDEEGNPIEILTETPEIHTGRPESDSHQVIHDQYGRPHLRPVVHGTPGEVQTDEQGKPLEGQEGVTETTHGHTGKPDGETYHIVYDAYGRPHRRPITHGKPGDVMTDEHGKPVNGAEGVTETPEGQTGKPVDEMYEIVYDAYGRPHKRPVTSGTPDGAMTDEHGKPIEGLEGVTETAGQTGRPDEVFEIVYDASGRPHKRPVVHKKPGSEVLTDEQGKPIEGAEGTTETPEGHTKGPEMFEIVYDAYGRPHKRPVIHGKPGGVMTDEQGKPVDGSHEGVTETPEGQTQKPDGEVFEIVYDEHGRPHKRPIVHGKPEDDTTTDEHGKPIEGAVGTTETPEGHTGKPDQLFEIVYDAQGRPHKRPVVHKKPEGSVATDEEGKPVEGVEGTTETLEGHTGKPDQVFEIMYDAQGRPHKRPVVHKKPEGSVATDKEGKPIEGVGGTTETIEGHTGKPDQLFEIVYDAQGRPHKRPVIHKKPEDAVLTDEEGKPIEGVEGSTELPEGFTGKPDQLFEIVYDAQGRPYKRPVVQKKPQGGVLTDEEGKPIEGVEGSTEIPEGYTGKPDQLFEIVYDSQGRPHKRPVVHKKPEDGTLTDEEGKPIEGLEGITEFPEGHTGKPDQMFEIVYDAQGRPHKRPVVHKKPEGSVATDEEGKPIEGVEGITETIEGHTGKPDQLFEIVYDAQGRPHKRPVIHKKPEDVVLTDEEGKPIEGVEGSTEIPEGYTGKPDQLFEIVYDAHGRPYKRPVVHKKPVDAVLTDEEGKPVEGAERITETPEGFTGKPDQLFEIVYDAHGRPHKRPVVHKKPEDGTLTDAEGKPIEGVEGTTEFPEGHTGKPDQLFEIVYDAQGRPHKRPVFHKKPEGGVLTDEEGKPIEGVEGITETPEGHTGKPDQLFEIVYDAAGRPHKRPVTQKKPEGAVLTDEEGKPVEGSEGTTETPEGHTGKPDQLFEIVYDAQGRPHKRPVVHKKPEGGVLTDEEGKPIEGGEGSTEIPEGYTGKPDQVFEIVYDAQGRPHKRPVHGKPGDVMTDEHKRPGTKPEAGESTETPEGHDGQHPHGTTESSEMVEGQSGTTEHPLFGEHGRPHKKPSGEKRPEVSESDVPTDEDGKPIEGVTGAPEDYTGRPESDEFEIFYDKNGRPHRRPVTHKKPGQEEITDEEGKPISGTTESPEGHTGMPEEDSHDTDHDQKKPDGESTHGTPGDKDTTKPESDAKPTIFGEHGHVGRPHKKPAQGKPDHDGVVPSEDGHPVDGEEIVTETVEGHTGAPESDDQKVVYDQFGKPHIRPVFHGKPGEDVQTDEVGRPVEVDNSVTEKPEGQPGKPDEVLETVYDESGRPYKRPVVHKKPGSEVLTDEHGKPVDGSSEGVTETPEGQTKPDGAVFEIVYDEHGRPHKRPVVHGKPEDDTTTDEHGKPIEGAVGTTETPEGHTGKPDQLFEIVYDAQGRPHKKPVVHKKPEDGTMTDEEGKPVEGVEGTTELPEGHTGKPDQMFEIVYDAQGRPHKRPVVHKKPEDGTMTDEEGKPIEGVEGTTEFPEGHTGKPDQLFEIVYDAQGRPHKRPVVHKKPEGGVLTDEEGKPIEGVEGITEIPEGHTGKPDQLFEIVYDSQGRPHKRPVVHKKPEDAVLTDEEGKPVEGAVGTTETPEGHTGKPDQLFEIVYDAQGRPHKRPVVHKKPEDGTMTDEEGKPIEGVEGTTETLEGHTGKPDQLFEIVYDAQGRPHKRPVVHKKPEDAVLTDEEGKPVEGAVGTTETPEGHTGKPDQLFEIVYDAQGRPHKRPVIHKKPEDAVLTDEEGKPIEGVEGSTEIPVGFTGKPDQLFEIVYDAQGRPHKRPVVEKKPEDAVMTDEDGKPIEGVEGTTETSEKHTGKPEEIFEIVYDAQGRPHKRPVVHKKPEDGTLTDEEGKPIEGLEGTTEFPEGQTGKPDQLFEIVYDAQGRPHKRPVVHKKPEGSVVTDEEGKPIEGVEGTTETIEGHTGKPDELFEIVYDAQGRPHKRPVVHKKPEDAVTTDKDGKPVEGVEGTTESAFEDTGKPVSEETVYDEHGQPHKKPVSPTKPDMEETHPAGEEPEGVTGLPEEQSSKPEEDEKPVVYEIAYDKFGRPYKRPVPGKPGDHAVTDDQEKPEGASPEDHTGVPESDQLPFFGSTGSPYGKPGLVIPGPEGILTDDEGNPIETITGSPVGHTDRPESDSHIVVYDQDGRPHPKPVTPEKPGVLTDEHGKPAEGMEGVTETSEGHTGKPETQDKVVYDELGRPQKPALHPVDETQVTHDEDGHPVEGDAMEKKPGEQTEPHGVQTGRPDSEGSPVEHDATSGTHQKPGEDVPTDGVTRRPEGVTGRPESTEPSSVEGELGHSPKPEKKPADGEEATTEEQEAATEIYTSRPESSDMFGEHGRPHKKPVKPGKPDTEHPEEPTAEGHVTETPEEGEVQKRPEAATHDETEQPEDKPESHPGHPGSTEKPAEEESEVHSGGVTSSPEEDHTGSDQEGQPQRRPVHKPEVKPHHGTESPESETEGEHATQSPEEGSTEKGPTGVEVSFDESGRPHKRPTQGSDVQNEVLEGKPTDVPELFGEHGPAGRPQKPGTKPEDHDQTTEVPEEGVTGKPEDTKVHYDEQGRPQQRPVPGVGEETEGSTERPATGVEDGGSQKKPEMETAATEKPEGRPDRPFVKPGLDVTGVMVDEAVEEPTATKKPGHPEDQQPGHTDGRPEMEEHPDEGVTKKPGESVDEDGKPVKPVTGDDVSSEKKPGSVHEPESGSPDETSETKPELDGENEIPGGDVHEKPEPEKETTAAKKPEDVQGLPHEGEQPAEKPEGSHAAEPTGEHPEGDADHPEKRPESDHPVTGTQQPDGSGLWQYLPPKASTTQKSPVDGEETTKPGEASADEDEDESLIITSEEDHTEADHDEHKPHGETEHSTGKPVDGSEEPKPETDTKTKPPEEGVSSGRPEDKPEATSAVPGTHGGTGVPGVNVVFGEDGHPQVAPDDTHPGSGTTPGLGASIDDLTTPGYGHGAPVTDKDGVVHLPGEGSHPTTHGIDGKPHGAAGTTPGLVEPGVPSTSDDAGVTRVPGMTIAFDEHGRPHLVPVPEHGASGTTAGETVTTPAGVTDSSKPEGTRPGEEVPESQDGQTSKPVRVGEDGKPIEDSEGTPVPTSSSPGMTVVFDQEGKPHLVPAPEGITESTNAQVSEDGKPVEHKPDDTHLETHDEVHTTASVPVEGKPESTPEGTRPGSTEHGHTQPMEGVDKLSGERAPEGVTVTPSHVVPGVTTSEEAATTVSGVHDHEEGKPAVAGGTTPESPIHSEDGKPEEGTAHGLPEVPGTTPQAHSEIPNSPVKVTAAPTASTTAKPSHGHLPQLPIGYLPSFGGDDDETSTKLPAMIDEGVHESSSPFDSILDTLANVFRPSQTTEEPSGTTEAHAEAPEEGSCYMDGVTYAHNSEVPPLGPCHAKCTCISSTIHCLAVKCPLVPEDVTNCTTVHEEGSCCPTYICGGDVTPTFSIESHEREPGVTEEVKVTDEVEAQTTVKPAEDAEGLLIPTKPLRGSTTSKPDAEGVTKSPSESHAEKPAAPETPSEDDLVRPEDKPQVVHEGSTEGPNGVTDDTQTSEHKPEEAEKPHEDVVGKPEGSLDETQTGKPERKPLPGQEQDQTHVATDEPFGTTSKPGPTGIETPSEEETHGKPEDEAPTKTSAETSPVDQATDRPQGKPHRPPSGYHPGSSDTGDEATILPPYFGTLKPGTHPGQEEHEAPESDDHVMASEKPEIDVEGGRPEEGEKAPHQPDEVTQGTTTRPHHEKPSEEKPEGESDLPATHRPSSHVTQKPETEGTTEGDMHAPEETVPEDQSATKRPSEPVEAVEAQEEDAGTRRPETETSTTTGTSDESEPSKPLDASHVVKPELDESEAGGHPADKLPASKPHEDTEGVHEKPQQGQDSEVGSTHEVTEGPQVGAEDTKPHTDARPIASDDGTELATVAPHGKPETSEEATGQPEVVHHSMTTGQPETADHVKPEFGTEIPESGYPTSKKPVTYDEDGRPQVEDSEDKDGSSHKEPESVSTDRPEGSQPHQPVDEFGRPVAPSGEPHPEHDETSADKFHPTRKPEDQSPVEGEEPGHKPTDHEMTMTTGKPGVVFESEKPSEEEPTGVQKKPEDSMPSEGDAEHGTRKPEEQEEPEKGQPGVHPTSPVTDLSVEPEMKPESGLDVTSGPEHDHPEKPSDGHEESATTEDVPGQKVPQTGEETKVTDQSSSSPKPEDFDSAHSPKPEQTFPGLHAVSGQQKPQTDDVPEDAFLHPTRTPGTYETEKPETSPEHETEGMTDHKPETHPVDETSTSLPEGIIRPITKRPMFGTEKPVSSDETTKPEDEVDQQSPEEGSEGKPLFEPATELPFDFAGILTTQKPFVVHGQQPEKEKPAYGDFQPGTGIYQRPEVDEAEVVHTPEEPTPASTVAPDHKPIDQMVKRPISTTNGTHFIQYVPYKEGEVPHVPEGATLGQPQEGPNGQKFWPVIYMKSVPTTTPAAVKPVPQIFNGTHFIQYVPYTGGEEPEVPEEATLGQPQKGPDGQIYWPVISTKPVAATPEEKPSTQEPFPGQIYNGTHFIQYVPFKEGEEPKIPEEATLGEPESAPNGQKYWPIISTKPLPDEEEETTEVPTQPEQIFNGTHFIQYAPYNDGLEPEIPDDATLGQPQKSPDGQIYWPIISTKPLTQAEPTTTGPFHPVQVFNGTNFIQYVPFNDGEVPEVPEGATLGQPQKGPDGQIYWPIIYMKPRPVTPEGQVPGQVFNGTHFIQYVPFKENQKPEVPENATLGQPQKTPDGQLYWPIIYMKSPTTTPAAEPVTEKPFQQQLFNGTHYIHYVPYTEGFEPELPEEATLGEPEKKPDGQLYWPIIYAKLPATPKPEPEQHYPGQLFNGTHFIQYVPYKPSHKPEVPEGVTLGQPQKGPDGKLYWVIVSTKPLPNVEEKPLEQVFNGTHFVQQVPFTEDEPELPEGATLGEPETGPDGQKFWPVSYLKPLPGAPIKTDQGSQPTFDPSKPEEGQVFNGTHFIQYVPYKPAQRPQIPEDATLGLPERAPNGQMYWPIIYLKPRPGVPIVTHQGPLTHDQKPTFDPTKPEEGQVFNGTHYIQYVPFAPGMKPVVPEEATIGQPEKGPNGQMYWPIIYMKPRPGVPVFTHQGPLTDDHAPTFDPMKPEEGQIFNGTHFIQYMPYQPTKRPQIPEDATLGLPERAPNGQMYWPIVYLKPRPGVPIVTHQGPLTHDQKPTFDPMKPEEGQVFNGTHYIQYVPFAPGMKPVVPEEATIGQPEKGPNGQMYWPIIYMKPRPGVPIVTHQGPLTHDQKPTFDLPKPDEGQIFNGTHYIQYLPYTPGLKPVLPEEATVGQPQKGPNGQMYWPIIYLKPRPGVPIFTHQGPISGDFKPTFDPTEKGQFFNGTHYIQYIPYQPGRKPQIPEDATLGHPEKRPNGQMYWPVIYLRPRPGVPIITEQEPTTTDETPIEPTDKGQVFNGTHFIQYVPYIPGSKPAVPEGAKLGQPQKASTGQLYWPIVYLKPVPGIPIIQKRPTGDVMWSPYDYSSPRPEQFYNGTHFIQYLPYNPTQMPEVPEGATLGHPQKGPGGQMYWVLISDKPIPVQTFNGTHLVQYVTPVTPQEEKPDGEDQTKPQIPHATHYIRVPSNSSGQPPVVPEGAVLGEPVTGPGGYTYWPITFTESTPQTPTQGPDFFQGQTAPQYGQLYNGTHYIQYVPYDPADIPPIPEGATRSKPQKGPDGQMYWVISSRKPLPTPGPQKGSFQPYPGQVYNGSHYIQYVPYNPSQMPQVPEGAVLGHPQKGPEGQLYWVIISDKPLPAQPGTQYVQYVTPVTPGETKPQEEQKVPPPKFNGTHFIEYVPYKPHQTPKVPEDAVLGELEKGPGGHLFWPIIFRRPPQGPVFNGTHYVQYVLANETDTKQQEGSHPGNESKVPESSPADKHPFWDYGQFRPQTENATQQNATKAPQHKPGTAEHAFWTYGQHKPQNGSSGEARPTKPAPTTESYPSWFGHQKPTRNTTRVPGYQEGSKLPSSQYGGEHAKPNYGEYESGYYKPDKRPGEDSSYETIDEDHLIEYPSGSDYDETQEQPYGPGTCRYAGKVYVSAQQIPRDDPCDFCFCFRSDIICLQQSCPPPIPGCHEEPIQGFCCPRYECHVRMATLLNVTSTTTTTTTTLPPHFLSHVYKGAAGKTGCFLQGKAYRVGQPIPSASGPCMDCICGGDGKMKCEPKVCTPEPMVRQMMVSSEKPITGNQR